MRILYDHQAFTGKKFGGVARYFYGLMRTFRDQNITAYSSVLFSNNQYIQSDKDFQVTPIPTLRNERFSNLLFSQINRVVSGLHILGRQYDVFHATFFHPYFLPIIGNKPLVLTYHDLIKEKFGEKYAHVDHIGTESKKKLLNRASAIIAVSHCTKNDLVEIYQVNPEKITVVYHATNFGKIAPSPDFIIQTPKHYFLYVGARNDYKNFPLFLEAFQKVHTKYPEIQLICAGGGMFSKAEKEEMNRLKIQNFVHFYDINDEILYRLYQNAIAFVYPSLYEGFGIPILEAFACQCPVLLSNASCFPEVAQQAALYFEPDSSISMANQMERVYQEEALRQQLIQNGTKRAQDFSPEKVAKETMAVYQKVVAGKK